MTTAGPVGKLHAPLAAGVGKWLLRGVVLGVLVLVVAVAPAGAREARARAACTQTYTVQAGDTLSGIATRFRTTVAAIAHANGLDPKAILPIGRVLKIPGACAAVQAVVAVPRTNTGPASLTRTLRGANLSLSRTGAIVLDLQSGATVYALNAQTPFAPASTEKLPLALSALQRLGPAFRTKTAVLGTGALKDGVWRGDLYLRGYGDPLLSSAGLYEIAHALRSRGVHAVTGAIYGDESFFDAERTGTGWKPEFYKVESPPLSALVVDRALIDRHMTDTPALAAAILFKRALARAGVSAGGGALTRAAPSGATTLVTRRSAPLSHLLAVMDTWSDNFIAELLLKQLGAQLGGAGTSEAGAAVVARTLAADGIPLEGRLVDGSGLSLLDRLSPTTLAATIAYTWKTPAVRALLDTLAVVGVSGTLRNRLTTTPGHELVHAKSGSTDECSALTGIVGDRYAFAVIENGSPVDFAAAHGAQDRFVTRLLAELRS
jgi:D-alanyl-D-alanine carboxypeptidase/D-alanyl-D-alanine-endopeptidase (penicillin-binding protein 4)